MTATYTPLANVTLGAQANSVTFGSIPGSYAHLILIVNATTTSTSASTANMRLNGDINNSYHFQRMSGTGSSLTAAQATSNTLFLGFSATASTTNRLQLTLNFIDYSSASKQRAIIGRASSANAGVDAFAGRYASTNAITTIQITAGAGDWAIGSTFSLYGVIA